MSAPDGTVSRGRQSFRCWALACLVLAGCAGSGPGGPGDAFRDFEGEWRGTVLGSRGRAAARLLIDPGGSYRGTLFFDGGDRSVRGVLMALPGGRVRYGGNDGSGSVTLGWSEGRRILRFVEDGGAGHAEFTRVPPAPGAPIGNESDLPARPSGRPPPFAHP